MGCYGGIINEIGSRHCGYEVAGFNSRNVMKILASWRMARRAAARSFSPVEQLKPENWLIRGVRT
jgi:hypothetical protein